MTLSLLIETDILVALISATDKHHKESVELLEGFLSGSSLSPYSLTELDLIIRSGEIGVTAIHPFFEALAKLLSYRRIRTLAPKPEHHAAAHVLRARHDWLTYFDSLHAATAMIEGLQLVSFDKQYQKIDKLQHKDPTSFL